MKHKPEHPIEFFEVEYFDKKEQKPFTRTHYRMVTNQVIVRGAQSRRVVKEGIVDNHIRADFSRQLEAYLKSLEGGDEPKEEPVKEPEKVEEPKDEEPKKVDENPEKPEDDKAKAKAKSKAKSKSKGKSKSKSKKKEK